MARQYVKVRGVGGGRAGTKRPSAPREALQGRINQLELNNAVAGVVRYPTTFSYNAGQSPFCGGGCGGSYNDRGWCFVPVSPGDVVSITAGSLVWGRFYPFKGN